MNCLQLFDRPVEDFVSMFRQEDGIIVFQHVAKTAGSSVAREFGSIKRGFLLQWDQMQESWQQFLQEYQAGHVDHVRGHLWFHHINDLRKRQIPHRAVCFLRHPVERLISHYRYDRTPANPNYQNVRARYPTFESFADHIGENFMIRMIVGRCDSAEQAITRIQQRFAFVGVTERYHTSMVVLMNCLGRHYKIKPKANVTESNQVDASVEISDSFRTELLKRNAVDLAVFEYFEKQYKELGEQVLAYLLGQQSAGSQTNDSLPTFNVA